MTVVANDVKLDSLIQDMNTMSVTRKLNHVEYSSMFVHAKLGHCGCLIVVFLWYFECDCMLMINVLQCYASYPTPDCDVDCHMYMNTEMFPNLSSFPLSGKGSSDQLMHKHIGDHLCKKLLGRLNLILHILGIS